MSLINDALKRAKQSQSQGPTPPAPPLHFRPVDTDPPVRHGLGLLLPAALAAIALLGLFFVWELAHQRGQTSGQPGLVARAASSPQAAPPPPNPPPVVPEPAPVVATPDSTDAAPKTAPVIAD